MQDASGRGVLPPTWVLLPKNVGLYLGWDFLPCERRPVLLGRSLGTAGSAGASRAKPVRAVSCRAASRNPRPRPPPDALTQLPAWRGARPPIPLAPPRGVPVLRQPGWSPRAPSRAGAGAEPGVRGCPGPACCMNQCWWRW